MARVYSALSNTFFRASLFTGNVVVTFCALKEKLFAAEKVN